MSKNVFQVYTANPSTTMVGTDLIYKGQSPYGVGNDSAILWSNFLNQINIHGFSPQNNVYVALNGSNSTGTGTLLNPFADPNRAMESITTANADNQFCIHVASGPYTFANFNIKPNISIVGDSLYSTYLTIANPITLDSSFSTNDSSQIFYNIAFANDVDFDLSTYGSSNVATLYLSNFYCTGTFTFVGRASTGYDEFQVNNSLLSILNASETGFTADSMVTENGLSYTASITAAFNGGFQLTNVTSYSTTSFSATSGNPVIGVVNGCLFYEAPSLSGSALGFEYDVISYGQFGFNTTSGTPTLLQMSLANGVKTNYSPNHFTATNASLEGAIAGIDTALAPASASVSGVVTTGAQTFGGAKTLTSPVFVTPVLGTPASGNLINCSGILGANVTETYSPTNYTPSAATVEGNLIGINTALGVVLAGGITKVTQQIFTSSGTYTPTTGMVYADIEVVGGGGGGGGVAGAAASAGGGGGGGGGGYSRGVLSATTIGSSQPITIGAAGNGGTGLSNNGTNGTESKFGTAIIGADGGNGGHGVTALPSGGVLGTGGFGGVSLGGSININGNDGGDGWGLVTLAIGGSGGGNPLAATIQSVSGNGGGGSGENYGGGGQGATSFNGTSYAGGPGASGVVLITEYCT